MTVIPTNQRDAELEALLAEFRRDGSLIREKARLLTEDGLEELYRRMQTGDTPTSVFLDIMKYLAEVGDLKPKQSNTPQQGPAFSITINIPGTDTTPPITLDATSVEDTPLGDAPIKLLDGFDVTVNEDLSAGSVEEG